MVGPDAHTVGVRAGISSVAPRFRTWPLALLELRVYKPGIAPQQHLKEVAFTSQEAHDVCVITLSSQERVITQTS